MTALIPGRFAEKDLAGNQTALGRLYRRLLFALIGHPFPLQHPFDVFLGAGGDKAVQFSKLGRMVGLIPGLLPC